MNKLKYTEEEWSFIAHAIATDIIENKRIFNIKYLIDIFNGENEIAGEDILTYLVEPIKDDWENYFEEAIVQGYELKDTLNLLKQSSIDTDIEFICKVCKFIDKINEFKNDNNELQCPECSSLLIEEYKEEIIIK